MVDFKSVVFAGGGSRCVWQVGFWDTIASELIIKPEIVAGVSTGAAMASIAMTGTAISGFNLIKSAIAANRKNFYFSNLLNGKSAFPHYKIYRKAVITTINEAALDRLKNGPEVRIAMAHPPAMLGARSAILAGVLAHNFEKHMKYPVHLVTGKKLGYTSTIALLNDCTTPDEAADLIMCSSCTPPLLPVQRYKGKVAIDGGVYDNVPVYAIGEDEKRGDVLVLLSRKIDTRRIPKIKGRVYVQPSLNPPVVMWDYANPDGLQKTFDMGRRDGETFIKLYSKR